MNVSIKELREIFLDYKKRIRTSDEMYHFIEILKQSKFISDIEGNIFLDRVVNGLSKDELAKKYGESKVSGIDISARLIERLSGFVRLYRNNINKLREKDQEIRSLKCKCLLLEQRCSQELQEEEEKKSIDSIDSEILSIQINQLNLSNRPLKILTSVAEVHTIGELLLLGRLYFRRYRNFGERSQDELDFVMSQFGFIVENRSWVYSPDEFLPSTSADTTLKPV